MRKIIPPKYAPIIYYEKEWMSSGDYRGYSGGGSKFEQIMNRVDFIFANDTLFGNKGEESEKLFICTATRFRDSIRLSDWRVVDMKKGKNSRDNLERTLRHISVPLESSAYYIGDVKDFKILTYRMLKVMYSHAHNFPTLLQYKRERI
jgi:hypothetical protein